MKLLFDQNLSPRLPRLLADVYPGSLHVRAAGLLEAEDFGRICLQLNSLIAVFCGNHPENFRKLGQSLFPGRHESIATRNGAHLGNPGSIILPIQNRGVIVKSQATPRQPYLIKYSMDANAPQSTEADCILS